MTKEEKERRKAICQLNNLKIHCNEMCNHNYGKVWEKDVAALNTAIEFMKNDRNEMIINDIKNIIKRYDDMNLSASFEERKENHIKAYMEIKDYFNNQAAEDKEDMKVKIAFPRSAKTQLARINEALEIAIKNLKTNDRNVTNGDMIKAMFPHAKIRTNYYTYCIEVKLEYHSQYDTGLLFDKGWWNAPYKRGE